jgi:DegV family protein with EDD domain
MTQTFLDGPGLRGALITAAEHVQRHRADLNRINVYPVPDGDTGTNFALTVSSIAERLRGNRDASVGAVARQAAEAGILGARGNCGMILSHFLLGFSESVGTRARLSPREFVQVLRSAAEHVYRALEKPVEGTMLTVMRAIAEVGERQEAADFTVLFERLLAGAREALASTPRLLPALARAGVVDAGAKGFVHLLEGIAAFLCGDPLVALDEVPDYPVAEMAAGAVEYPSDSEQFRFCTEGLVRGPRIPPEEAVRAVLREQGDSLVVIRAEGILKVHVHTDDPDAVFAYLRGCGELVTHKAEDMRAQHAAVERARAGHLTLARRPLSIVADTACDLPDEVVRAHGMHLVPLSLVYPEGPLRDRVDVTASDFLERLRRGEHPSTSQPTPGAFMEAFRAAGEEGEAVVAVLLAGALSGTLASAQAAVRQRGEGDTPVHLVDSRGTTLLQGLMTLKAAELGEAGWEPARIAAELSRIRDASGLMLTVDTFERLLASGRVGRGRAWLGGILDIKPILGLDATGKVVPIDRVRGRKNVLPRMMELLEKRVPRSVKRVRFGIPQVACPEIVDEVTAAIRARWGEREVISAPASPIIATHVGEGAWGIAWLVED